MRACPTNSPSTMDELMEFRAHGNELAQEDRLDLDEEVIYGVLANVYWVTAMEKMGRFFAVCRVAPPIHATAMHAWITGTPKSPVSKDQLDGAVSDLGD